MTPMEKLCVQKFSQIDMSHKFSIGSFCAGSEGGWLVAKALAQMIRTDLGVDDFRASRDFSSEIDPQKRLYAIDLAEDDSEDDNDGPFFGDLCELKHKKAFDYRAKKMVTVPHSKVTTGGYPARM